MKRLLACICGLLMLAGLAVPAAAAGEAVDPIKVSGTLMEKQDQLAVYEKDAPLETLAAQLDTVVYLRPYYKTAAVTWNFEGGDLATTGRKTLRGQVEVPDTYVYLKDGQPADLWVERQVMVYEEGMAAIETVQPNRVEITVSKMLLPLGSGQECLAGFMAEPDYPATLETADELTIYTRASFDSSRVDLNKAGCYYGFAYDLPACFAVAQDDPSRADVVVLRDDIVDLTLTYLEAQYLSSKWLLGVWEPTLWMAKDVAPADLVDETVWAQVPEKLEDGLAAYKFSTDMLDDSTDSLSIPLFFFYNATGDAYEPGTYYFQ
ncbi:hypothetical protein LJC60_11150, partial [Ruminococcaceae bacterium OttesenSCG-928-D13]|nr:hypothetical protein [Ruminococcaceae bacterium OttesenSCG-928-D13]